ncbi:hypothetical protein NDU88_001547 [Pleurodeles waltl]|uniref:Uncharacterized protein n=1 Tax=Pleurodeles waltl TaxID=8319 RepID=A0AAV7MP15_PLEWA|nr:hypothetical protein NDU88_001547 [Pleurodeles waltl]
MSPWRTCLISAPLFNSLKRPAQLIPTATLSLTASSLPHVGPHQVMEFVTGACWAEDMQRSSPLQNVSLQLSGGPRKAPRPSIPGTLAARGAKGKARPAAQAAPRAAGAHQLLGRSPLLPRKRRNPAPTGAAAPRTPGGSRAAWGKPPGLPQTGHRSLFRAEVAERKQERPSAPPS